MNSTQHSFDTGTGDHGQPYSDLPVPPMRFSCLKDRFIVKPDAAEQQSSIIVQTMKKNTTKDIGTVVYSACPHVPTGCRILFGTYAGLVFYTKDEMYITLVDNDLIAIIGEPQ